MNVLVLLLLGIAIIIIIYLISRVVWWFITTTTTLTSLISGKESKTIKGSKLPTYNSNFNFTYSLWLNIDDWSYRYGEQKVILQRKFKTSLVCPKIYLDQTNNTISIQYTYILPGTNNSNPVTKTQTKQSDSAAELNRFFNNNNISNLQPTLTKNSSTLETTAKGYSTTTLKTHITSPEYTHTASLIEAINKQGDGSWGTFKSASQDLDTILNGSSLSNYITEFNTNMNKDISALSTTSLTSPNSLTYNKYYAAFLPYGVKLYNYLKGMNISNYIDPLTNIILDYITRNYLSLETAIINTKLNDQTDPITQISPSLIPFVATLQIIYNILTNNISNLSSSIINTDISKAITYLYNNDPTYEYATNLGNTPYNSLRNILKKQLDISSINTTKILSTVSSLSKSSSSSSNTNYCQLNDIFIDYSNSYKIIANTIGLPSYYNPNHGFDTMNEAITYCNSSTRCAYISYNPDTKKYYLRNKTQSNKESSLTYFKQDARTYMRNGDPTNENHILTDYCNKFGDNTYAASRMTQINSEQSTSIQYSNSTASLEMIPLQEWFNIIFSFNQNVIDIYLNGKLVKSEMIPGTIYNCTSNSDITITPNGGFDGWTSSIQYLDDAVSPEQAYNMYNTGFGGGIFGSLFDKYKVKFTLMHGNVEDGSYTI